MLATTTPKIGLLYAGQGSQVPQMGKDFYEKYPSIQQIYDQYPNIRELAFNADESQISETKNTQPILMIFQIAMTDLLQSILKYEAAMGISLGEYGALYSANVLTASDVMTIIQQRANSMSNDIKGLNLSSIAVLSKDFEWLIKHAGSDSYYISNINSPSQMVITGEHFDQWSEKLQQNGYSKLIKLPVSGGFHSPYMKNTEKCLSQLFENISFAQPTIPIYYNYGTKDMDLKNRMAKQASHTINVHHSLVQIIDNCDVLIEIGANGILQSMVKKINRQKEVYPLHTVEDFEKVRSILGK